MVIIKFIIFTIITNTTKFATVNNCANCAIIKLTLSTSVKISYENKTIYLYILGAV